MHPSVITDVLLNEFPTLSGIGTQIQLAYAELILKLATGSGKQHHWAGVDRLPEDAMTIYCRKIDSAFGQGRFNLINDIARCIERSQNWHMEIKETRAWWLSDFGKQVVVRARKLAVRGYPNLLLDSSGHRIKSRKNGIYTARDSNGRNAVTNGFIKWPVPLNLTAIQNALEIGILNLFPETNVSRIGRIDVALRALHACALNENVGYGLIPQVYRETESGRLYGCDSLSLQNTPREAKRIALCGAYDYDFSNCHFRLLHHYADRNGIDTAEICRYLKDTRAYRQGIADELNITYIQAKECLLATLYGATQTIWQGAAIAKRIGPEKAGVLYDRRDFNCLGFEIQEVRKSMLDSAKRLTNGAIVNCRGKACHGNIRQELAHLLQGLESELLHIMIREYGDSLLIIQHDGFTMSERLDAREMEQLILRETGIEMPVEREKLNVSENP